MPRTIVCGVDTSDASKAVAGTARRLADGLDARLVLLHVSDGPPEEAEELIASLGVEADDVRVVEGSPAERLLAAVDEDGAELLVVGSRGRGSLRSAGLPSTTRTSSASTPRLAISSSASSGGPSETCSSTRRASRPSASRRAVPATALEASDVSTPQTIVRGIGILPVGWARSSRRSRKSYAARFSVEATAPDRGGSSAPSRPE